MQDELISRQAVLEIAKSSKSNWIDNSVLFKRINELPSVKPQESTGHWIEISRGFECDQCHGLDTDGLKPPYCKWCGAKMIESQESER